MPSPDAVARFRSDLGRLCDPREDTVLVAVSGGADSVALLLLAHAVLGERCRAATVDHGLREAAADEARFVAHLCDQRGIAHSILRGTLPDRTRRSLNLSARARALRYQLLEAQAAREGEAWLATAHHADDQLETLVMRLNRGAGAAGLAGIRVKGGRTIRPLLGWRRAELEGVVASAGITPIDDPTNRDDRFDRARLRKDLAGVSWLDAAHWSLSARALGEAEDALAWAARGEQARCCRFVDGEATLDAFAVPRELRRRLVERCIGHIAPEAELRGPALLATIERLESGKRTTVAGVSCTPDEGGRHTIWRFTAAPPRRSG